MRRAFVFGGLMLLVLVARGVATEPATRRGEGPSSARRVARFEDFCFVDPQHGWAWTDSEILRTLDEGKSWKVVDKAGAGIEEGVVVPGGARIGEGFAYVRADGAKAHVRQRLTGARLGGRGCGALGWVGVGRRSGGVCGWGKWVGDDGAGPWDEFLAGGFVSDGGWRGELEEGGKYVGWVATERGLGLFSGHTGRLVGGWSDGDGCGGDLEDGGWGKVVEEAGTEFAGRAARSGWRRREFRSFLGKES